MAPGTGSTAVGEHVLIPALDGAMFPERSILDERGMTVVDPKHGTLRDLLHHGLLSPDEAASLFKFSTVRNPFDVLVTEYVRLRTIWKDASRDPDSFVDRVPDMRRRISVACETDTFAEWVERSFRVTGRAWLHRPFERYRRPRHYHRQYIKGVDFVMRFERLQDDFGEVLRRLGVSRRIEIPRVAVTQAREADYRSYYTPKARGIVEHVFARDLERFGYSFE